MNRELKTSTCCIKHFVLYFHICFILTAASSSLWGEKGIDVFCANLELFHDLRKTWANHFFENCVLKRATNLTNLHHGAFIDKQTVLTVGSMQCSQWVMLSYVFCSECISFRDAKFTCDIVPNSQALSVWESVFCSSWA